jgi:hypothetical protein
MKHLLLFFLFISLSIATVRAQSSADLRVYPNPASEYIQLSDNGLVETVAVYNLAGMEVRTFDSTSSKRYFVGDLPKGMYLVQLLGPKRERIVTRRLNIR